VREAELQQLHVNKREDHQETLLPGYLRTGSKRTAWKERIPWKNEGKNQI